MNQKCNVQRFYNYHVIGVETLDKRNIYCAWLIDEIEAYSRPYAKQGRVCWMTFTIFVLPS